MHPADDAREVLHPPVRRGVLQERAEEGLAREIEGPVIRLRMVAEGDTIDCDHVAVTYYDGTTHNVFSGIMVKDSIETITFPEGDSRIRHVDFACKAQSVDGARIALSSVSEGWDRDHWASQPTVTTREADAPVVTY